VIQKLLAQLRAIQLARVQNKVRWRFEVQAKDEELGMIDEGSSVVDGRVWTTYLYTVDIQ
jgi:hypothetical protein